MNHISIMSTVLFVCSLLFVTNQSHIPFWLNMTDSTVEFYISSTGNDTDNCGSEMQPCGTMLYTLEYIKFVSIQLENIKSATVVIRGQNKEFILKHIARYENPCYGVFKLSSNVSLNSITFQFDPNFISSKEDWFPTSTVHPLCNYQLQLPKNLQIYQSFFNVYIVDSSSAFFTVIINNCIIDHWIVIEDETPTSLVEFIPNTVGILDVKYIFNNLTFHNNHARTLIIAPQIEINRATFENNTFYVDEVFCVINNAYSTKWFPEHGLTNMKIFNLQNVKITGTNINNMTIVGSSPFLCAYSHHFVPELQLRIYENTFNDIFMASSSLIFIMGYIQASTDISIHNISFSNITGNIIYAYNVQYGPFTIKNVNISTSYMITPNNITDEGSCLFYLKDSQVNITNLVINYNISDILAENCQAMPFQSERCPGYYPVELVGDVAPFILYLCNIPIPLVKIIDSEGFSEVRISVVEVHTDISQSSLDFAKYQLFKLFGSLFDYCSIYEEPKSLFKFWFDEVNGEKNAGFINIGGGKVLLDTITMHGTVNSVFLIQNDNNKYDEVQVSNLYSNYNFQLYGLSVVVYILRMGDGVSRILNSILHGATGSFFEVISGDIYISNTSLNTGTAAIHATYEVNNVYISDCQFINVGKYYGLDRGSLELSSSERTDYDVFWEYPSFALSAQSVSIQNCYISTYDPSGILLFAPNFPNTYYNERHISTVVLYNNTIKRNNSEILYDILSNAYQSKGQINVIGNVQLYIIGNTFIEYTDKKPLFYFDTPNIICFSGNNFTSSTIMYIDNGYITSCYRTNIRDIYKDKTKCHYQALKRQTIFNFVDANSIEYWTAVNAQTPIINNTNGIWLMMDNIIMQTDFNIINNNYKIMSMNHGEFVFLDLILAHNMYFELDETNCVIECFDICANSTTSEINSHFISQLHISCNNTNQVEKNMMYVTYNQATLTNHATPYYINYGYDKDFVVDSNLTVLFEVLDQFYQIVHDYSCFISINFISLPLSINNTLNVSLHDIIVLHPQSTNEKAYEKFTIASQADNNALLAKNNISIIIIPQHYHPQHILDEYLLLLLLIPFFIITFVLIYCRRAYMNAFIVDEALVLIIGIAKFDDSKLNLHGVQKNVTDLSQMWSNDYRYEVYVCNEHQLYCTKQDVIDFVDKHKKQLGDKKYKCVIVHIISHCFRNT
eukprot:167938_1